MGFTYWQVLPFNPIDGAGRPYCSPSAVAGNYLLIDPQGLLDMGLATAEEVAANRYDGTPYTADFAFAGDVYKRQPFLPSLTCTAAAGALIPV